MTTMMNVNDENSHDNHGIVGAGAVAGDIPSIILPVGDYDDECE